MNEIVFEGEFEGNGYRSKFRIEDDGDSYVWRFFNSVDLYDVPFEFPPQEELMSRAMNVYMLTKQKIIHKDKDGQLWAGTAKEATNG